MKMNLLTLLTLCFAISCAKKDTGSSAPAKMQEKIIPAREKSESYTATNSREQSMQIIQNRGTSFGSKMSAAENYFLALGIQNLSTLTDEERAEDVSPGPEREAVYLKAVREFILHTEDIARRIRMKQMSPMNEGKPSERAFYAIAAMMDSVLIPGQVSFYELIRQAMIHEANGKPLEEHEKLLMAEPTKKTMINLIKARLDMSAMLALKSLTTKDNISLLQRGSTLLFKISFGLVAGIELPETFATSSDTTKDQVVKYLDEAREAKDFLREFQIGKDLERNVRSAFMKLKLEIPERASEDEEEDQELSDANALNKLKLIERKKEIRERIDYLLQ